MEDQLRSHSETLDRIVSILEEKTKPNLTTSSIAIQKAKTEEELQQLECMLDDNNIMHAYVSNVSILHFSVSTTLHLLWAKFGGLCSESIKECHKQRFGRQNELAWDKRKNKIWQFKSLAADNR